MMTYEIDVKEQVVRVGPRTLCGYFAPDFHETWKRENFLHHHYWYVNGDEEKDAFRVARDELIERGLIPDE